MIKNYDNFTRELNGRIKSDDDFFYELLTTVIKNPERYTRIFRVSNARTKLIQNVTQSREIKFGGFMEDIITRYISAMGYENLSKKEQEILHGAFRVKIIAGRKHSHNIRQGTVHGNFRTA